MFMAVAEVRPVLLLSADVCAISGNGRRLITIPARLMNHRDRIGM